MNWTIGWAIAGSACGRRPIQTPIGTQTTVAMRDQHQHADRGQQTAERRHGRPRRMPIWLMTTDASR